MSERVIEIISILVKEMLKDKDILADEEVIIQALIDEGFELKDIEVAFEFIFSSKEIIETVDSESDFRQNSGIYTPIRVLAQTEKEKLSPSAQGFLYYLKLVNIITAAEMERILEQLVQTDIKQATTEQLIGIIKRVIHDPLKFSIVHQESIFTMLDDKQKKVYYN